MSVTQTVEIPANRRLTIDVPREVPVGPVILTFTPKAPVSEKQGRSVLKSGNSDQATPHTDALLNIFSNLGDIDIDKIREERLAKHL